MLRTQEYLALCHELLKKGFVFTPRIGSLVGRGFADIGYEEFLVTSHTDLLSLNTGKPGKLPETWREHFFPIWSPDETARALYERDIDIMRLEYRDQRLWVMHLERSSATQVVEGATLDEVFTKALLWSLS